MAEFYAWRFLYLCVFVKVLGADSILKALNNVEFDE